MASSPYSLTGPKVSLGFTTLVGMMTACLIYSLYALSIVLFLVAFTCLFTVQRNPFRLQPRWKSDTLKHFLSRPEWWIISVPFVLALVGGLYSDDTPFWLDRLQKKLPFLLAPLAFFVAPKLSTQAYMHMHRVFIIIVVASTLPLLADIIVHYHHFIEALRQGRPLTTPVGHVRYSLLLALTSVFSFLLALEAPTAAHRRRWLGVGIYMTVFIHLLAVRTGLFTFYLALYALVLIKLQSIHLLYRVSAPLIVMALVFLLAIKVVPTFEARMTYMIEDLQHYQDSSWHVYSDAERLLSNRAGLALWRSAPWCGIGTADLRKEMSRYFEQHFGMERITLPHNQFITIGAAHGTIGLAMFLVALFLPILHKKRYREAYFMMPQMVILASMLTDSTFDTTVGIVLYLMFTLTAFLHQPTTINPYKSAI